MAAGKEETSPEAALQQILDVLSSPEKAVESGVCPLCVVVRRSVERTLRAFFTEFVNDIKCRDSFRQARGFCAVHTPLLESLGDALAVAILYSDLAEQTRLRWQEAGSRRRKLTLRPAKGGTALCLACVAAEEAQERYARALAAGMERQPEVWNALEARDGLCIAHGESVLAFCSPTVAERFRQQEIVRLTALQTELKEIIRKNDYRFRGEPWGAERDAWFRALRKLTKPT